MVRATNVQRHTKRQNESTVQKDRCSFEASNYVYRYSGSCELCFRESFFFLTHHGTYPQQQCVIMILIADVDTVL